MFISPFLSLESTASIRNQPTEFPKLDLCNTTSYFCIMLYTDVQWLCANGDLFVSLNHYLHHLLTDADIMMCIHTLY